ncbi:cobalt-precorrin-5B (C(1))-methyltransferase CbiD [Bengtsoniella intestinalis]|uniref:cobalt-precorrin-5B (C(1))-methyltransferase CbiD n=1 Tax=Bengtsoniella intestinalis TaxID=3073143 RepID=UPI00391F329B
MQLEHYIHVGRNRLRCGYTTGTCAAAASRGAAEFLVTGTWPGAITLETPAGIVVTLELLHCTHGVGWASCAVVKDGGDDPDVTHGTLIFARVEVLDAPDIVIDGGFGVGRITRAGLDQDIGQAAINSVPRRMIGQQLEWALEKTNTIQGLKTVISVPEGEKLAKKTFNPRLGIVGGISILGTSGIVRPMSEEALIASQNIELDMLYATGARHIVLTPGNYGANFCNMTLGLDMTHGASCSNFLGVTLDYCAMVGFESVLLVGHLGKLIKVAAGIFNTHSKVADGRREVLVTHGALCGGDGALLQALFHAITTDEAVELLEKAGILQPVVNGIVHEIETNLKRRAGDDLAIEVVVFSNQHGILGKSEGADGLIVRHQKEERI